MLFIILPISMAVVFLMWTFSIRLAAFLIGNFGHFPTTIFGSGNRSWILIYIYIILMLHWILLIVDDIDDIDNIWCRKGKDRYGTTWHDTNSSWFHRFPRLGRHHFAHRHHHQPQDVSRKDFLRGAPIGEKSPQPAFSWWWKSKWYSLQRPKSKFTC